MRYLVLILLSAFSLAYTGCKKKKPKTEYKIFKYNQADGLSSLDPAAARNQPIIWAVNQLFNGLVELDDNMQVVPCIAERWEISPDGKTYTFYLNKNVYFHKHELFPAERGNRRRVTAEDFVYSFKRIVDPATLSSGAWIFNDKVLRTADGAISDTCFKATDTYTLKIYLNQPFTAFMEILTMPYACVVPREVVEKYGKDFRTHAIGTGPFYLKTWKENSALVLLKNPDYFKKDSAGNRLPYLDGVHVSFINDKHMALLSFRQGKIDFVSGIDENSRDIILQHDGSLKPEFKDKFNVEKAPYLNTEYLGFNIDDTLAMNKNNPLMDKRVRMALSYSIDRKKMITYVRNNLGIPAYSGFIPNCLPSFDSAAVKGYDYNPELALKLLAEAGYPSGKGLPAFTLYTNADYKEISEFLQKQWSEAGFKVELSINPIATHRELVDNSRVSMFRASWLGDYPDAENYLTVFYGKNFSPGGPNKTHFKNAEFDALYEKAKLETDTKTRWELYRRMDNIVMQESPVIVLFYDEVLRLTQKNISGLKVNPMNMLKLERVKKM